MSGRSTHGVVSGNGSLPTFGALLRIRLSAIQWLIVSAAVLVLAITLGTGLTFAHLKRPERDFGRALPQVAYRKVRRAGRDQLFHAWASPVDRRDELESVGRAVVGQRLKT